MHIQMLSKKATLLEARAQLQSFERSLEICKDLHQRMQKVPGLEELLDQIQQQCYAFRQAMDIYPKKMQHSMRLSPDISDHIATTVKKEPMDSEYDQESREI